MLSIIKSFFIILQLIVWDFSGCFANLKVLALNSCGIKSWASVQFLEPFLPCLEELYLASNSLSDLPREQAEREYRDATGDTSSVVLTGTVAELQNPCIYNHHFVILLIFVHVQ